MIKPRTILYYIEIGWLTLFNSLDSHGNYTATCSVTIKKTGKQVALGFFTFISALCVRFYDWEFLGAISQGKFICTVRQFCEKINSFTVITSKTEKSRYFFHSRLFTFHLLVQLLLPMVKLNGVNQQILIEDGAWLESSRVWNPTFRKLSNLRFFQYSAIFWNRSQMFIEWKKMDYLCNSKSEIGNVCNAVEGHCLEAMKIVHHHANGRFDWLIS